LKSARFEHLGQSLGESLPTLRAQLATMQIDTDGLSARIDDLIEHLEKPRETTMLRVLETKAAAGDIAIAVTSAAMRICGGAAFSKHMSIERLFRDARSEEHTSELQSLAYLVCRLLLEKKKKEFTTHTTSANP